MLTGFYLEIRGCGFSDKDCIMVSHSVLGTLCTDTYIHNELGIEITSYQKTFSGTFISEKWISIKNISDYDKTITRIDTVNTVIDDVGYDLKYFRSGWGIEFTPEDTRLGGTIILNASVGRSSCEVHPWFSLKCDDGMTTVCSIAWSGNWIARFEPLLGNKYRITCGLNNWEFYKTLKKGEWIEGIHVFYVTTIASMDQITIEFARWGKKYLYPKNNLSESMPIEWNHWWPYEDDQINEDIFKKNVDEAALLGIDVCTLDAGWFGPSEENSEWYSIRGDWNNVNTYRFPSGIRALSDYVHEKGLKFGIWCEIEALGTKAVLSEEHPEFAAINNGKYAGFVCMGNPDARIWAFETIEKIILEYKADWIKIDFNINPCGGCNRTDHGHQAGDGLYEHYLGLYKLLDEINQKYPEVVIENCSSGGLRIDYGIVGRTHFSYLSDPDYPDHNLQLFWGASSMLHPTACLHWAWSEINPEAGFKWGIDFTSDLSQKNIDCYLRTSMLNRFGVSWKLPDLSDMVRGRLKFHINLYKATVAHFIKNSDVYRLTDQTIRRGIGHRWSAFLYVLNIENNQDKQDNQNNKSKDALLFVFRMKGAQRTRTIKLMGLEPHTTYVLENIDTGLNSETTGDKLMDVGLLFDLPEEDSSEIIHLKLKEFL